MYNNTNTILLGTNHTINASIHLLKTSKTVFPRKPQLKFHSSPGT